MKHDSAVRAGVRWCVACCHLADSFCGNAAQVLPKRDRQIVAVYRSATRPQDWQSVAELSEMPSEHGQIRIALGIHPWFSDGIAERDCVRLKRCWRVAGMGRRNRLGFLRQNPNAAAARTANQFFVRQLAIAQTLRHRVIIHNLKATADIAA